MKTLKILVAGFLLSSVSHAAPLTLTEDNKSVSFLEKLGILYAEGSRPQLSQLVNNIWVGRCFFGGAENKPVGSLIAFREGVDPAGPLAPRVYEARAWSSRGNPEQYDSYTYTNFNNVLYLTERLMFRVHRTDDTYSIIHPGNPNVMGVDHKQSLKMNQGYLIMEVLRQKNFKSTEFELDGRCYFFKSVEMK